MSKPLPKSSKVVVIGGGVVGENAAVIGICCTR